MHDRSGIHSFLGASFLPGMPCHASMGGIYVMQAVCRFSCAGRGILGKLDNCPARHSISSMHCINASMPLYIHQLCKSVRRNRCRASAPLGSLYEYQYGRETSRSRPVAAPTQ